MGKKKIRLTEKDLKRIVRKSIVNVLGCGTVNNNHVLREENVLRNDDLMEYAKLGKQYTGLNVDVFVDDGEAYKRNKHPLWIYVRNGYSNTDSFFPVVVSKTPFVPSHISKDDINIQEADLEAVMVFVSINALLLRDFADEKVEHMDFYKICKPVIYDIKKTSRGISLDEDNAIVLNSDYRTNNVGRNIIYEMARLNKKDGSQSPFPSNKYKLWVQGDNSPHKPPHMHVYFPQDGWQIKVYIEDGELWDVVSYGNRGRSDKFIDVIKMVKEWFLLPTTMPGRIGTNQQAAADEWDAIIDL